MAEVATDHHAVVQIARPRKAGRDWICTFRIIGVGDDGVGAAYGIDSVQALVQAIAAIRGVLDKSGRAFTWAGGEPGSVGFPRAVPEFFGLAFSTRVDQIIDRETEKFARDAKRKAMRRSRKRPLG